ncbi:MAG: MFS transporter [Bacteroidetes bacterium]|nr:MFS transporter [Rhodothermia bacterium]MCS7154348.1 MFS transporter [Bacteroidota bacterium]MCX7906615.1 MFS transporter [Bacteroidota bacterium]MDW8137104.1 MFS transporter [Bacteroidota bacterium]MDW8285025.1 MFS transporter [Bacteroidota bacterium]
MSRFAAVAPPTATLHALWPAYLVLVMAFFDNLAVVPLLAPYGRTLGADPALTGLIVAAYSITNLLGNIVAGYALDRWGRRRPLLLSLWGTALVLSSYAMVRSAGELLILRAVHGFTISALTPAAVAAIGDRSPEGRRSLEAGRIGATIGLTAVAAPPLGGLIGQSWGIQALFWSLAALMALSGLVAFLRFPETLDPRERTSASVSPWSLLRQPGLRWTYVGALGLTLAMGALTVYLPLTVEELGYRARTSGLLFGLFALLALAVMLGLRARRDALAQQWWRLRGGLLGLAAGLILVGAETSLAGLLSGMGLFGVGFGFAFPAMTVLVQSYAPSRGRGTAVALFFALYSLGVILGQTSSGLLLSHGLRPPLLIAPGLGALALWLTWRDPDRRKP